MLTIGRVGVDVDLTSPSEWNPSGDQVSFKVTIAPEATDDETAVDLSNTLVRQLSGLVDNPDEPVVPVTWDAWPAVDGWYEVIDLDLDMVGASLAHGLWRLSGRLRRVSSFASPVHESRLLHARREDSAVSASACDPLHGIPGSATVYRRGSVGLGGLNSRSCAGIDGSAESVLVNVWSATDAQADAEFQVEPADAYEGACRFRVGPALVTPSILHRAVSWWDARSYTGSGDLLDLVGSVDGTLEDPTPGRGPLFCPFEDDQAQYAFFPGWADEGASTTRVAAITGTFDVRWDADDHGLAVGGPNVWVCHQGSDDDELGFAVGFDEADGQMVMLFSPDGSFVGTVQSTVAPTLGTDGQRRIAYNSATGDVTFYERATGVDLASNVGWTQVGSVVAAGGTGSFNSDAAQTLAISGASGASTGSEPEAQFDGQTMGYRGHLRRLLISHGGGTLKDFDPDLATRPFASFTGGASETWTFFRAASTSSYRVDVIDRPCFQLGNGAHFAFGDNFDSDATTSLTVSWWGWHQSDTPTANGWIGKIGTLDGSTQGYVIADISSVGGQGGSMLALPGPVVGQGGFPSQVATGVLACWSAVIDRAADTLTLYRDGTAASPIDISGVGSVTNAVDFAIGLVGAAAGQMAVCGAAVWSRALSALEVAQVADEGLDDPYTVPEENTWADQFARYHDVIGRQVPGDLDPNQGWLLTNGRIAVFPTDDGSLTAVSWGGTSWESATRLTFTVWTALSVFVGVSLNRNSPNATSIRLLVRNDDDDAFGSIDLTVRRGGGLVEGLIRMTEEAPLLAVVGLAAGDLSSLTGGARRTDNDLDGNQYVITTATAAASLGGSGGFSVTLLAGSTLDFGFGHAIGGSGASGIETAAALAQQYAGLVSERVDVVAP